MHIWKEADKIDHEPLHGGNVQIFRNKEFEQQEIIVMRQCESES